MAAKIGSRPIVVWTKDNQPKQYIQEDPDWDEVWWLDKKTRKRAIKNERVRGPLTLVEDFLYISNGVFAASPEKLRDNNIRRIINLGELACFWNTKEKLEAVEVKDYAPPRYLRAWIPDEGSKNISDFFMPCIQYIQRARVQKKRCLLHCYAGKSRSVTIGLTYLVWIGYSYDVDKLIYTLIKANWSININQGFVQQLKEFSNKVQCERKLIKELEPPSLDSFSSTQSNSNSKCSFKNTDSLEGDQDDNDINKNGCFQSRPMSVDEPFFKRACLESQSKVSIEMLEDTAEINDSKATLDEATATSEVFSYQKPLMVHETRSSFKETSTGMRHSQRLTNKMRISIQRQNLKALEKEQLIKKEARKKRTTRNLCPKYT